MTHGYCIPSRVLHIVYTGWSRKKKTLPIINEAEENDITEKRDRCVLSGNSKQYLGKEYTEQQINEMDSNSINILSNVCFKCTND